MPMQMRISVRGKSISWYKSRVALAVGYIHVQAPLIPRSAYGEVHYNSFLQKPSCGGARLGPNERNKELHTRGVSNKIRELNPLINHSSLPLDVLRDMWGGRLGFLSQHLKLSATQGLNEPYFHLPTVERP
jgi:hypothetical protein